jgi:hypothetical protein
MAILKYYNTATSAWEYIAASTTANFTSWKKTMSGGETSVSGTDDNAVTLSYTVGLEQVFINGVLQVRGADYTATDGTSIDSLSALVANDIVTVVCYAPFNVANTIAPTVVDAKGDLLAGTAADTVGRLAVGTDGQLLAADSGETTGLKWTNPGLTLLNTTSFSAVASASVDSVFTSTYDQYKILVTLSGVSADGLMQLQLRASGSTLATNYNYITFLRNTGDADGNGANAGNATIFCGRVDGGTNNDSYCLDILVNNPFAAKLTTFTGNIIGRDSAGLAQGGTLTSVHTSATSADGIIFSVSAGNATGIIKIYGINK